MRGPVHAHGLPFVAAPLSLVAICNRRWTFNARIKALPGARKLIFTGTSFYRVQGGLLVSQRDVWDAVDNNDYLSVSWCLRIFPEKVLIEMCILPSMQQAVL